MKCEEIKTKMDPVIDELLGNVVVGTAMNEKELSEGAVGQATIKQSESNCGLDSKLSSVPGAFTVKKFFADLTLYDGPIVGMNQITRAEFLEKTNGSGTVGLIAPNNLLTGTFHFQPAEDQKLTILSSKTRNTIKLMNDRNSGFLTANDEYGTRLECVYGT